VAKKWQRGYFRGKALDGEAPFHVNKRQLKPVAEAGVAAQDSARYHHGLRCITSRERYTRRPACNSE
jgi:hypothetical protein